MVFCAYSNSIIITIIRYNMQQVMQSFAEIIIFSATSITMQTCFPWAFSIQAT